MDTSRLELEILSNVLKIISLEKSKSNALNAFLNEIIKMPFMRFQPRAGIFIKDEESQSLSLFTYTNNFSKILRQKCSNIKFGQCLCGKAAEREEIIFAKCLDEMHEIRYEEMEEHGHYCVPFFDCDKQLLGVLVLYLEHGHCKQDGELKFLETISYGLSVMCQLFDESEKDLELARYDMAQTMITSLNHEINNPLTICMGNISLLNKEIPDNKRVKVISDSLKRIEKIVKEIDTVSKNKIINTEPYLNDKKSKIIKID